MQTARDQELNEPNYSADTIDVTTSVTVEKAAMATQKGYQITGYVLRDPDSQDCCLVENGRVRWASPKEMSAFMH